MSSMLEQWLASAGLAHLSDAFQAHGIEHADLTELTEDDLREIGLNLGERKRFRRALATSAASVLSRERRPLTLAFFDLVDSSALCEELDGEDMVEVLRRYREFCSLAIDKFGGHVAHLLGDGVLAYFCYPVAHENDAERAVRAAMAISGGIRNLDTPGGHRLAVRCGIASGRVVVTELFTGRAADKHAVTGSAANLAARLQSLAPSNGIVLSETTWRQVDHFFDCEDLGERQLKGFSAPVRAFRVRHERPAPRSPEAEAPHLLTPFFGRKVERRRLIELWQQSCTGSGRAVLLQSEAGNGKSRLVGQFISDIRAPPEDVVRLHSSYFEEHSPLGPFFDYIRRSVTAARTASGATVFEALRAVFPEAGGAEIASLAAFLSGKHDPEGDDGTAAEHRRRVALQALAKHFECRASRRPLLLVVEDAHWLDASSKELLGRLIAAARQQRCLMIITSRLSLTRTFPEIDPAAMHSIELAPIEPEHVHAMVRSIFGDEPVPQALADRIATRSDGVPLFVEELLRPFLKQPARSDWKVHIADATEPGKVPATLSEALMARLDRLGTDRKIAQVASVIGQSIERDVFVHVLGDGPEHAAARLRALIEAGVLKSETGAPRESFTFSHVLLRDTAYDSLLRQERQLLHARVADALLSVSPQIVRERPEVVATHLVKGGRLEESLSYWLSAGRMAAARSALHEARHLLERGATIAEGLQQTPRILESRLEFASLLGPVLFALCGPGSPESRAVYRTATELAEAVEESGPHFAVLWGWWRLTRDFREKANRAALLMHLAQRRREPEMLLQAHHCNWASCFHAGDLAGSRQHIQAGLEVYDKPDCDHRPWLFGNHDAKVCGHGELAQIMWMVGDLDAALLQETEALECADRMDHGGTRAHAFDLALLHRFYRRDVDSVRRLAEQMIAFAEDRDMMENCARGELFRSWALGKKGDPRAGLATFESAYRQERLTGTGEDTPVYLTMYAEILNDNGEHDRALTELHNVRAQLERVGIRNWAPEIWRMIGETTLLSGGAEETALAAFESAKSVSRQQGATMLQLRIHTSELSILEGSRRKQAAAELRACLASLPASDGNVDILCAEEACGRRQASLSGQPALGSTSR